MRDLTEKCGNCGEFFGEHHWETKGCPLYAYVDGEKDYDVLLGFSGTRFERSTD